MKKILKFLSILLLFFTLFSCEKSPKSENKYYINIENGIGSGYYNLNEEIIIKANLSENDVFVSFVLNDEIISTEEEFKYIVTGDAEIICNILKAYYITYDLGGGTADNPTIYNKRTKTFTLNNPHKDGYEFVGWTYEKSQEPVKSVTIEKGSTGDLNFVAHYEKFDKPDSFENLKMAVFSDIQLTTFNRDATTNSYISLIDHFNFAKNNNVDVILMNGDIVNNAVASYYELYNKALVSVYGTDKSLYPEIIYNMGNHEWWDTKEQNTEEALSLYYQYANVDSKYLVSKSEVKYYLNKETTIPTYYKVINGVPFIVISGEKSSGEISDTLKKEIESYRDAALKLPYVIAGGPIFVLYHYAIKNVSYQNQGTTEYSQVVDQIFKSVPNAIIFTGDTHFPGVNERAINQVDYTSINVGSSSYSRMVSHSATTTKYYDNLKNSGAKNVLEGEVSYKYEFPENVLLVEINEDGTTSINRYMLNGNDARNLSIEWTIPLTYSKTDFIYTDNRFKNKEWANMLYSMDGLMFDENASVSYALGNNMMYLEFDDCIDFNMCEHYLVTIESKNNPSTTYKYDYCSNYYKWDIEPHQYHIIIDNIDLNDSYKVTVQAFDFFDNESLNVLETNAKSEDLNFPDLIDYNAIYTYSDISKTANYSIKAINSPSSIECFYQGTNNFNSGMIVLGLICNGSADLKEELESLYEGENILEFKVYNPNDFYIDFGLTVTLNNKNGTKNQITDFGSQYLVRVEGNEEFTLIQYDLSELFNITSLDDIDTLRIKAKVDNSVVDTECGYNVNFYIDDVRIK